MFSFEKLDVYKEAYGVNLIVYRLLKSNTTIPLYAKNQLGRASLSVVLNIAEGSAKFSKKDRRNFFVIARGSVFECLSLINILSDENEIDQATANNLRQTYTHLSRLLFSMIKNLETI